MVAREQWMARKEAHDVMGSLTCFLDLDDGCSFDEFGEALQEIDQLLAMPAWQEKRARCVERRRAMTPMNHMVATAFSPLQMAKARARHERLPVSPDPPDCKSAGNCSSTSSVQPSNAASMSDV